MMNTRWHTLAIFGVLLATGLQTVHGQTFTGRSSTLNYAYVFGAGGDSHVGNDTVTDFTPLDSDTEATSFADETEGVLPGDPPSPYYAAVSVELEHEYSITGDVDHMQTVNASGSSLVAGVVSGAGLSQMNSVNPGNELILNFTVNGPTIYHIVGAVEVPGPTAFSGVRLEVFNGFNWVWIFNTIILPGTEGPFDVTGTLTPGQYRIVGALAVGESNTDSVYADYYYTLELTPKGDMNCDGKLDGLDVQAFVEAILDAPTYQSHYPTCNMLNGDMTNNNTLDMADVDPFAQAILGAE